VDAQSTKTAGEGGNSKMGAADNGLDAFRPANENGWEGTRRKSQCEDLKKANVCNCANCAQGGEVVKDPNKGYAQKQQAPIAR